MTDTPQTDAALERYVTTARVHDAFDPMRQLERRHNRLRAVMDGLAADFLAVADDDKWNGHIRDSYRYCANQIRAALEEDEKQSYTSFTASHEL